MTVYYLLFREAMRSQSHDRICRRALLDSQELLKQNRELVDRDDMDYLNFRLWEFNRLNQQGTNDATSIIARFVILAEYLDLGESVLAHFRREVGLDGGL